jgi:hypothetical protein
VRRLPVLIPLALLVLAPVAACGDGEDDASTGGPEATEPAPPDPEPGQGGIEHASGPADVVLRIAQEGGLAGPSAVSATPTLVVLGDGRLVQPGVMTMQYPGPLLPPLQERSISEDGIQRLLALADDHGLLADVTYERPEGVMDAPDTVVTIAAGGGTYEHRAYALGIGGGESGEETDPARAELQAFVQAATELASSQDPALGAEQPYQPEAFLVRAVPDAPTPSPEGLEPRVVDWPASASLRLADAGECAEAPAAEVGDVLAAADELTRFLDGGMSYAVTAVPVLPGVACD